MNTASPNRIRQDRRLIGKTLLKLALPRMLVRGAVLIVALIIWLMVSSWLLNFGSTLNFEQLQTLGQQAVDLFARINPYLWWVIVAIWSLIVFFTVRAWIQSDIAAARAKPVATAELSALTAQVSDEVVDVLRWVWGSREEPFTVGDLRRASIELRHSRIARIDLVREQSRVLDASTQVPVAQNTVVFPSGTHASSDNTRPSSNQRIEPNL
jgi:hypothetical protein